MNSSEHKLVIAKIFEIALEIIYFDDLFRYVTFCLKEEKCVLLNLLFALAYQQVVYNANTRNMKISVSYVAWHVGFSACRIITITKWYFSFF